MAQLKLRIAMNKGRRGVPLEKLGDVARQFDRFLRTLASDLSIDVKKGEILADKFQNGSVMWDPAYQGDVSDATLRAFNRSIEFIADFDPESDGTNGIC